MSRLLTTLPLVVLLAASGGAFAQDTATDDNGAAGAAPAPAAETAPKPEAGAKSDADAVLDTGREVQEDPSYVKETYGDWQLQCFRTDAKEDPCHMYQLLHEDAGNPVAEISVFKLPEGSDVVAGATVVVPLGTLLPSGLQIAIDDGTAKAYNFAFCTMTGCYAQIGFNQADLDALRGGKTAFLTIVPARARDQRVVIKASLKGFTKAYENVPVTPK